MVNLRVFSGIKTTYDFVITEEQLEILSQLYESIEKMAERRYPRHNFYCFGNPPCRDYFIDDREVSQEEYEETQEFENVGCHLRKKEIDSTFKKIILSLSEMNIIKRGKFEF